MKTIVLQEPGLFSLTERNEPIWQSGMAKVKVHRVGICGTDLHAFQGKQNFFSYPRVMGHELAVEIQEIEKNNLGLKVGDFCAVEPYLNCGACIACRRGKPNCCMNIEVLGVHVDGGMQDMINVPIHKLHKSNNLPLEHLALVETLGIGAHAVQRTGLESHDTLLIIGAGPIGLTCIVFAQIYGANIAVMDVNQQRLQFIEEKMNVEHTLKAEGDIPTKLESIFAGDLPTAVIDCTGNPQSMANTFNYTAHGGCITFVGHFPGELTFHDPNFHKRELTIQGSRNSTPHDFKQIIQWMEEDKINLDPWITHRVAKEEMIEAFPSWIKPETGVLKAMVNWNE